MWNAHSLLFLLHLRGIMRACAFSVNAHFIFLHAKELKCSTWFAPTHRATYWALAAPRVRARVGDWKWFDGRFMLDMVMCVCTQIAGGCWLPSMCHCFSRLLSTFNESHVQQCQVTAIDRLPPSWAFFFSIYFLPIQRIFLLPCCR